MGNFLEGMEETVGIPRKRVLSIGLDVIKMMKLDNDIKTTVDLLGELKKKYSGDELMIAAYAAGIVQGADGAKLMMESRLIKNN